MCDGNTMIQSHADVLNPLHEDDRIDDICYYSLLSILQVTYTQVLAITPAEQDAFTVQREVEAVAGLDLFHAALDQIFAE